MSVQRISQVYNPITGVFGNGFVQVFGPGMSGTWTVPPGVNACRVRLWGGGGNSTGSGAGFALKTIYALGVSAVAVTVADVSGTSSFGSFVSASGGSSGSTTAGSGSGGDINTTGGSAASSGGGGAANLFGRGGAYNSVGASGFGSGTAGVPAGSGLTGLGGVQSANTNDLAANMPAMIASWSIDFIGTGGGGGNQQAGWNGGGGGNGGIGGFPGGGGGAGSYGAPGLVIVEW
jgi:hypothetical protein